MSEHVQVEKSGPVLAITLARPERRNAITVAMYSALAEAVESAAGDRSIRVVTFAGKGQDFAAGNDLADFLSALPRGREDIPVWRLLRALVQCEIPIVAAVHGNCVGIGTTMLLHCDLVIAEENARFSLPFSSSSMKSTCSPKSDLSSEWPNCFSKSRLRDPSHWAMPRAPDFGFTAFGLS